jgi:hypothetical protein
MLQLNRGQLRELVGHLKGQPAFFWVNEPQRPLLWVGHLLRGVSELLETEPPASALSAAATLAISPSAARPTPPLRPAPRKRIGRHAPAGGWIGAVSLDRAALPRARLLCGRV